MRTKPPTEKKGTRVHKVVENVVDGERFELITVSERKYDQIDPLPSNPL